MLNNRARDTLMPIVKENVITISDLNDYDSNEDILSYSLCTQIYSDCWSAYNYDDFRGNGYLLHYVNHSHWF